MKVVTNKKVIESYQQKVGMHEIMSNPSQYPFELRYYSKGEHICITGEPFQSLFFLLEGNVKVYTTLANGKSLLYKFFMGFELIGDIELSIESEFRTNIQAITNVICFAIPTYGYTERMRSDSMFMRYVSRNLGLKLEYCSRASSYNLLYPLENRLASYIVITEENGVFSENLVQVSELLATSYRHLMRTLREFCEKEYLQKKSNFYFIIDKDALLNLGAEVYIQ